MLIYENVPLLDIDTAKKLFYLDNLIVSMGPVMGPYGNDRNRKTEIFLDIPKLSHPNPILAPHL